jgi:hypothetical protein
MERSVGSKDGKGKKKSPVDQSLAEHMKLRDSEKGSEARLRRAQVASLEGRESTTVVSPS